MKNIACLVLATAALALTGCTGVYVSRPIGDRPHALVSVEWEGTWISDSGALVARVTDAAAGKLEYVTTELRDGAFVTKTTKLTVREAGAWLFASLADDNKPDRYEWARLKLANDQLSVWVPAKEKIRALVTAGKLRGRFEDEDVMLEPLSAAELMALTSGALGVPFKWDEPLVLRRLGR